MLLSWWCPFKMKKGKWPTIQFKIMYRYLPLDSTFKVCALPLPTSYYYGRHSPHPWGIVFCSWPIEFLHSCVPPPHVCCAMNIKYFPPWEVSGGNARKLSLSCYAAKLSTQCAVRGMNLNGFPEGWVLCTYILHTCAHTYSMYCTVVRITWWS